MKDGLINKPLKFEKIVVYFACSDHINIYIGNIVRAAAEGLHEKDVSIHKYRGEKKKKKGINNY